MAGWLQDVYLLSTIKTGLRPSLGMTYPCAATEPFVGSCLDFWSNTGCKMCAQHALKRFDF